MTGDSEDNIEKMSEEKPKIKRSYSKKEKYGVEQAGVANKLNEILGINEKNNKFILEEFNMDREKQEMVIGLEEEVKKYFAYADWGYFKKLVENRSLSLARTIYKNTGYDVTYKKRNIDGKVKTEYYITKKTLG
jgi:hypothetical protein